MSYLRSLKAFCSSEKVPMPVQLTELYMAEKHSGDLTSITIANTIQLHTRSRADRLVCLQRKFWTRQRRKQHTQQEMVTLKGPMSLVLLPQSC